MSQIEKVLVTTLEASRILSVQVASTKKALKSCGFRPHGMQQLNGLQPTYVWVRAEVQQAVFIRAERKALATMNRLARIAAKDAPARNLATDKSTVSTYYAGKILSVWKDTKSVLEAQGLQPVGMLPSEAGDRYFWSVKAVQDLKNKILSGEIVLKSGNQTSAEAISNTALNLFRKKHPGVRVPSERPDLLLEWCECLELARGTNQKAV